MKLDCATCGARYSIDESIIPPQGAKIRCRKCGGVIPVAPRLEPAPVATSLVPPSPQPAAPPAPAASPPLTHPPTPPVVPQPTNGSGGFSFLSGPASRPPSPPPAVLPAPPPPAPVAKAPAATIATAPLAVATPVPTGLSPEEQSRHEKARRLARVLASDIAIYNREKKDRGLSEGNLVAVLGYEIKKSWEIYKERVGTEFANATPYFRDALNDLLAEGKKIF